MESDDYWGIVGRPPDEALEKPQEPTLRDRLRKLWPWVSKRQVEELTLHSKRLLNEVMQNERLQRKRQDAIYTQLNDILTIANKGNNFEATHVALKSLRNVIVESSRRIDTTLDVCRQSVEEQEAAKVLGQVINGQLATIAESLAAIIGLHLNPPKRRRPAPKKKSPRKR